MSQFYDQASLVMVPSGYKDGKLYSQKPLSTSGELSFSRGSDIEATRVNANGYIEKAEVNLLTYSNDFSNVAWIRVGAAPTSGQSGYDGSSDAWLLSASGAGAHYALQSKADTAVSTFSVYAKQGTSKGIRIAINGGGDHWANFNLDLGTQIGTAASVVDTEITSVGGGWYRISVTANKTGIGWGVVYILDNSFNTSFTAAGETIYIQDAQLNYGLVAQTYQETTTAAVVSGITNDMPRLNYDPANPTCPSLLLEGSRTNLFKHSEFFGASYWVKNDASITDNATTSPEGVVNAAAFTENSSTSTHFMQHAQVSASASTYYSASFFVKYNGRHFQIVGSTGSEGGGYVNFDLVNGVVGSSDQLTGTIENYGGGWYRCTGTNISTSSATEIRLLPYLITSPTSARAESYAGNGTSGVYIYGAQMEQANYQSSMVPTYGSSATRTADACSKTGITSLIGQSEGTIFLEVDAVNFETDQRFAISDGTSANRIALRMSTGGVIQLSVVIGSTTQASISGSGSVGNNYKIAGAYKANDFVLYINGSLAATDTSGSVSGTFSRLATDNGVSGQDFYNPIKQALLFKTRLSNADLATLTSL